jgi:hypothetical protein
MGRPLMRPLMAWTAMQRLGHGRLVVVGAVISSALLSRPARAIDEIQVYNAAISEVGQWAIEQHLNYTWLGRTSPDFPGGLISHHSLQGTPELAYGVTDWWEIGFYAPFAVTADGRLLSNGAKIRNLFVVPNAAKRDVFYGVNIELSYETPPFAQTRYAMEIRPIIGARSKEWEFIVNPIVDFGLGAAGQANFAPALRLARKLGEDRFVGLEYYADLGEIGNFPSLPQQSHQLFGVVDFKVDKLDVELGIGYGLTPGSDRLVAKAILGYAFPAPGDSDKGSSTMSMTNPLGRQGWGDQLMPWPPTMP